VTGHIALFLHALSGGGAERITLILAEAFAERGHRVDLVLARTGAALQGEVAPSVRVVDLGVRELSTAISQLRRIPVRQWSAILPLLVRKTPFALHALPALERYLREARPDAMLSGLDYNTLVALWAGRRAGGRTRQVVTEHLTISPKIEGTRKRNIRYLPRLIRQTYPLADAVVAVSHGVADDVARTTGLARSAITTVYNPSLRPDLEERVQEPVSHPWLDDDEPVLLAVGRLHKQKDYPNLFRALARLRAADRPLRLIVLGEGSHRPALEAQLREMGLEDCVSMPGFVMNPIAYMARASALVMSSAWEGLPGVLVEAMGCGCPVVSTDCPAGPREILDDGKYGPLAPVGDDRALADAIASVLDDPPDRASLEARAAVFGVAPAADRYLELLLGPLEHEASASA
jgi:glycosyltransferase involved in cell wall biosynthesis